MTISEKELHKLSKSNLIELVLKLLQSGEVTSSNEDIVEQYLNSKVVTISTVKQTNDVISVKREFDINK